MTDPTEQLFAGLDAPRPLPPELRERLAEQLLAQGAVTAPMPLPAELDERLASRLTDPIAAALVSIDGPRDLPSETRDRLQAALLGSRRRRRRELPPAWIGAAAALVALAAIVVAVGPGTGGSNRHAVAQRQVPPASGGTNSDSGAGSAVAGTAGGSGSSGPAPLRPATAPSPSSADLRAAQSGAGGTTAYDATVGPRSVSPDAGPLEGGTLVHIEGSDLKTTTAVYFGSHPANFQVVSADQVRAYSPQVAAPATVDVIVALQSGARYVLHNAFSYLSQPVVSAVSPSTGSSSGGTWVVVRGSGLRRTTRVEFGGTAAGNVRVISDTEVRALSPHHLPGPVDVLVTTPGGTSAAGGGDRFTYLP